MGLHFKINIGINCTCMYMYFARSKLLSRSDNFFYSLVDTIILDGQEITAWRIIKGGTQIPLTSLWCDFLWVTLIYIYISRSQILKSDLIQMTLVLLWNSNLEVYNAVSNYNVFWSCRYQTFQDYTCSNHVDLIPKPKWETPHFVHILNLRKFWMEFHNTGWKPYEHDSFMKKTNDLGWYSSLVVILAYSEARIFSGPYFSLRKTFL